MSDNALNRRYTVSKHSGPVYVNSYALRGIGVRYRNPTSLVNPVSLPTGWTQPRLEDTFTIQFALENSVLQQAAARRQAIVGEVPDPNSSLRGISGRGGTGDVPLIPYQSSGILIPVPVSSETQETNSNADTVTKPLGEMSLRDFEGDSNDPFESTALQAIDVFSELQSVLQPELTNLNEPHPQAQPHQPSSNQQPPSPNTTSVSPAYSFSPASVPQNPVYSTSGITTGPGNVGNPSHRPPVGGVGVLVNFGGLGLSRVNTPPSTVSTAGQSSYSPSTTSQPQRTSPVPMSTQGPPVLPKPQTHYPPNPSPPSTNSGPAYPLYSGVPVLPPIDQEIRPPPYTENPSYTSEDLYITVPSSAYHSSRPNVTGFRLPDIQSSLTPEEREAVTGISEMGFPTPRVARAFKSFDGDSQKILDFLVLVSELEGKGHNGDSAEVALLANDQDKEKSLEYLSTVAHYKEVWPEQSIHDAYQDSGKDWDKTVDILTQGR